MQKMTTSEINKAIAKMLGFRAHGIKVNGVENADAGWIYPKQFENLQCSTPAREVPDFIRTFKRASAFLNQVGMSGQIKHDYGTNPTLEDILECQLQKEKNGSA